MSRSMSWSQFLSQWGKYAIDTRTLIILVAPYAATKIRTLVTKDRSLLMRRRPRTPVNGPDVPCTQRPQVRQLSMLDLT